MEWSNFLQNNKAVPRLIQIVNVFFKTHIHPEGWSTKKCFKFMNEPHIYSALRVKQPTKLAMSAKTIDEINANRNIPTKILCSILK